MAGKQEYKAMKCSQTFRISHCSDNQPICIMSIQYGNPSKRIVAAVAFVLFLWPDGFFYLDHTTTNLTDTCHPEFTPGAKLKGIRYMNEQSKLMIKCVSPVSVHPSQLTILLEMLDDFDGPFQSTTNKSLIQNCELLHQKKLRIDHAMSSAEKAMEFLSM
jgi:hypothetical protein